MNLHRKKHFVAQEIFTCPKEIYTCLKKFFALEIENKKLPEIRKVFNERQHFLYQEILSNPRKIYVFIF